MSAAGGSADKARRWCESGNVWELRPVEPKYGAFLLHSWAAATGFKFQNIPTLTPPLVKLRV